MVLNRAFRLTHIFTILCLTLLLVFPTFVDAYAEEVASGGVEKTICKVVDQLQGPIARGIAAIGIIFLGFSLFLGKISWGVALALAIGIGAIFGAPKIVQKIGDGGETCAGQLGKSGGSV